VRDGSGLELTEAGMVQSPVTEVLLAYFPSDISAAEKVLAAAQFQQYIEKGLGGSADVKGVSFG